MSKKGVVLVIPGGSAGHVNSCISLCYLLKQRGHRIVFAAESNWTKTFLEHGFEVQICNKRKVDENEETLEYISKRWNSWCHMYAKDATEQCDAAREGHQMFVDGVKHSNDRLREIISNLKPDVIIVDSYATFPAIVCSKIPFVNFTNSNPLFTLRSDFLPPPLGLSFNDDSNWQIMREMYYSWLRNIWHDFNEWVLSKGVRDLSENVFLKPSPYLNIQLYPRCLYQEYADRAKFDEKWIALDHATEERLEKLEVPEQFEQKPGKTVYFSLGSMASSDINLMTRLLSIFSKSTHKFIVSLGFQHEKYKLYENMWGQKCLPQLQVLQKCNLFITHGGNNSFIEAMYFGVPMIVIPLFGDQFDNAQRLVDTKLGMRLNPFKANDEEILSAIDTILTDETLLHRLKVISDEIKKSDSLTEVTSRIERIAGLA